MDDRKGWRWWHSRMMIYCLHTVKQFQVFNIKKTKQKKNERFYSLTCLQSPSRLGWSDGLVSYTGHSLGVGVLSNSSSIFHNPDPSGLQSFLNLSKVEEVISMGKWWHHLRCILDYFKHLICVGFIQQRIPVVAQMERITSPNKMVKKCFL